MSDGDAQGPAPSRAASTHEKGEKRYCIYLQAINLCCSRSETGCAPPRPAPWRAVRKVPGRGMAAIYDDGAL